MDEGKIAGMLAVFGIAILLLSGFGCTWIQTTNETAEYCAKSGTGFNMSFDEAKEIALRSECVSNATLAQDHWCNNYTGTWWISLNLAKPGCHPACVINVEDKTAEINWMCTGLIVPENETGGNLTTPGNETAAEVTGANNQFAADLYQKYKSKEGNVFFSPYSISTALAMTYEGAKGQTADEMRTVFHFPADQADMRAGYLGVYSKINAEGKNYTLKTANALWAQNDFHFEQSYFDTVGQYYGGHVTNLDFRGDTENSRLTINSWVENQTNNRIKDLIPAGVIAPDTRLVLTNAIYFKGKWKYEFNSTLTEKRDFHIDPSNTVQADMMSMANHEFKYMEDENAQVIELPYSGDEVSMLVILPKNNDINGVESSISYEKINGWKANLHTEEVQQLYLPKFKFETKYFMAQDLADMGMPTAFTDDADFSGMTGKRDLAISAVIHQAFVEVNEEGTEAAAATAVVIRETSMPGPGPEPIIFNADHPFIFVIQDRETGNILFMGRVSDPTIS